MCFLTLTTNGLPNELIPVAASYDQTLKYGAQTPFSDQLSAHFAGSMWEYDTYHDSILTVGNGGTKPTQAAFIIFYNQGTQKYELDQTLQPGEQMWIDIGKLIRQRLQDKNGTTLPSNLTSGSYETRDLGNPILGTLFEGKVIYDKTYGHVTYGCAACCGYDVLNTRFWYDPLGVPFGSTADQGVFAPDECQGGALADVSDIFYSSWSTANTSVATVDSFGMHTGVAIGSTTSFTSGRLPNNDTRLNCPLRTVNPGGGDNVLSCTISQRASDQVSSDDAGITADQNFNGTTNLGPILPVRSYGGCAIGFETIGHIFPSTYNSTNVILHRWLIGGATWVNSGSEVTSGPNDDTSPAPYRDDVPQSGASIGTVYDTDAPYSAPITNDGKAYRARYNFYAYAALPNGTQISPNFYFYVRFSCTKTDFGYQFVNDVPGDNQIAPGTTSLNWNLQ